VLWKGSHVAPENVLANKANPSDVLVFLLTWVFLANKATKRRVAEKPNLTLRSDRFYLGQNYKN
jgi:hypothetical protein